MSDCLKGLDPAEMLPPVHEPEFLSPAEVKEYDRQALRETERKLWEATLNRYMGVQGQETAIGELEIAVSRLKARWRRRYPEGE